MHALLAVVCDRAPELVPARDELQLAVDDLAGLQAGEPDDALAADAPDVEVVRVLDRVPSSIDRAARPRCSAARGCTQNSRATTCTRAGECAAAIMPSTSVGRAKALASGMIARGVGRATARASAAVDAAEVGGRLEVAVGVEPAREARELADHLAGGARADQERDAGGAVVGAGRGVLAARGGRTPTRRSVSTRSAIAARLEVALEGEQRVGGQLPSAAARALPPASACVSNSPGRGRARRSGIGRPAAIIAASPASLCGNGSLELRVGDRAASAAPWRLNGSSCSRRWFDSSGDLAGGRTSRVARARAPNAPSASSIDSLERRPQHARRPERVLVGGADRRDRQLRGRERRLRASRRARGPAAGCRRVPTRSR